MNFKAFGYDTSSVDEAYPAGTRGFVIWIEALEELKLGFLPIDRCTDHLLRQHPRKYLGSVTHPATNLFRPIRLHLSRKLLVGTDHVASVCLGSLVG